MLNDNEDDNDTVITPAAPRRNAPIARTTRRRASAPRTQPRTGFDGLLATIASRNNAAEKEDPEI